MFGSEGSKNDFLQQARTARRERQTERHRSEAIIVIQRNTRGYLVRKHLKRSLRQEVDAFINSNNEQEEYSPIVSSPAQETLKIVAKLLFFLDQKEDKRRCERVIKYLMATMEAADVRQCYASLALNKASLMRWLNQVKRVCWECCCVPLQTLKPELARDSRIISTYLAFLLTFTSCHNWKILNGREAIKPAIQQFCANIMGHLNLMGLYNNLQNFLTRGLARARPALKSTTLTACITLTLRPVQSAGYSSNLLTNFTLSVFSVPALIHHISTIAPQTRELLIKEEIFSKIIDLLGDEQNAKIIFNSLQGNYALCLLANLIDLGGHVKDDSSSLSPKFLRVVGELLQRCQFYVRTKQSSTTHWHPILGWFSQPTDQGLYDSLPLVSAQLNQLWSSRLLKRAFSDSITHNAQKPEPTPTKTTKQTKGAKSIFKKAFSFRSSSSTKSTTPAIQLDSKLARTTCGAATMYTVAIDTLSQCKMDILSGISIEPDILPSLWNFLCGLTSPTNQTRVFLDLLVTSRSQLHPVFNVLCLFCDAAMHVVTIVDDIELYEQNTPFEPAALASMSQFINQLLYALLTSPAVDSARLVNSTLFTSLHSLLSILYTRDCRRSFCEPRHWLIRDLKSSTFLSDLEKKVLSAQLILQKMPHVIPFNDRVKLFRRYVHAERESLGLCESVAAMPHMTHITIHRNRLLEDGYQQLAALPVNSIKGVIRVKFINEQGLDEIGIDQMGVFKEFLEDTIKRVFDPALNLFKPTEDHRLYPSPTSHVQEGHLHLFEFVGRMLGKAVYEGILVDVPFATFFLTHLLGRQGSTYSSIDELPSLDPGLYRNLSYVKHYEGDVSELDLTFSMDEDVLGRIVTHELIPGGKCVSVNNSNRISYVHLMAHYRMFVQIRQQTQAVLRGFKAVISRDWLAMFSAPELQKLISGDSNVFDLHDLRKHAQYHGGFHNNHQVINWLFEVLDKDFSMEERGQFLKFVTSCSKPPLLGFAHLDPPFAIRCVEVSEEQDTGDTVGTVLKGFLSIRKKENIGRLPTSSTCFNLLKLPNYKTKSTLREKLRYSIKSNTGFELS